MIKVISFHTLNEYVHVKHRENATQEWRQGTVAAQCDHVQKAVCVLSSHAVTLPLIVRLQCLRSTGVHCTYHWCSLPFAEFCVVAVRF